MGKMEKLTEHIRSLEFGTKLSVRTLAKDFGVSEATAYKAIKAMEEEGYLATRPRTGTMRVESPREKKLESITYEEVLRIVDGELLGGAGGLEKTVSRFNIGAMTVEAMKRYLHPGGLLIVGNRDEVHTLALSCGVGVLITGGFHAVEKTVELADRLKLPVISTSYDSFTTGSLINRAISENLIKQTIPYAGDLLKKEPVSLWLDSTVKDFRELSLKTNYEKFPVVDRKMRVQGIITTKEVVGREDDATLDRLMRKVVTTFHPKTTVSYIAHVMDWEDLPLCPITEGDILVGVVTRTDILKALQERHLKPMESDTLEDRVLKGLTLRKDKGHFFYDGKVTTDLLDSLGNASRSILSMLMVKTSLSILENRFYSCTLDSVSLNFLKPLEVDTPFTLEITIIQSAKTYSKVDIALRATGELIAVGNLNALHTPEQRGDA
jgi:predicted transcriptional regulator